MLKRIFLFLATNIAVLLVISLILNIFNIRPYLTQYGIDYQSLLIYALVIGFTGSLISLFMSKTMAIRSFNIHLIEKPQTQTEVFVMDMVKRLVDQRKMSIPDVGIYESPEPNAFATGWNKNNALLAISTGLLQVMNDEEVEGVLGHEVSHIANGDMVTLTLIQGVVNTFVVFFANIAAILVSQLFRRNEDAPMQYGFVYQGVALLCQFLFGILATLIVMWFSRHREYRADAGSAQYLGKEKIIKALERLQQVIDKVPVDNRAPAYKTMKISDNSGLMTLFASHPPLEKRIAILQKISFSPVQKQ